MYTSSELRSYPKLMLVSRTTIMTKFSFGLDTSSLTIDEHFIQVWVTDTSGNMAVIPPGEVKVRILR